MQAEGRAAHPAQSDLHQNAPAVDWDVGRHPLVIAVHPRRFRAAARALIVTRMHIQLPPKMRQSPLS
jgi:hypothetical protein